MDNQIRPNVLDPACGSRQALNLIADKWTMLVVYVLAAHEVVRYGELHRQIGGVSQKMLTQTLRKMERDGIVNRKVFPVVPPKVEYSLTPLGNTLIKPLTALCRWAETNMARVEVSRVTYRDNGGE
jgi:DNA-binding HxlR family transcriptional regulator